MKNHKKRFLIMPGKIVSKNDKQVHFVSGKQLITLYGVEESECVIYQGAVHKGHDFSSLLQLAPRYRGDYKRHLKRILKKK